MPLFEKRYNYISTIAYGGYHLFVKSRFTSPGLEGGRKYYLWCDLRIYIYPPHRHSGVRGVWIQWRFSWLIRISLWILIMSKVCTLDVSLLCVMFFAVWRCVSNVLIARNPQIHEWKWWYLKKTSVLVCVCSIGDGVLRRNCTTGGF